jgi:hypothetical protein
MILCRLGQKKVRKQSCKGDYVDRIYMPDATLACMIGHYIVLKQKLIGILGIDFRSFPLYPTFSAHKK